MSEAPSGTTSLTALLELILVRSFATPLTACEAITYGTTSQGSGASASISSAPICSVSPAMSVDLSPKRAASQPPNRFVMIPNAS